MFKKLQLSFGAGWGAKRQEPKHYQAKQASGSQASPGQASGSQASPEPLAREAFPHPATQAKQPRHTLKDASNDGHSTDTRWTQRWTLDGHCRNARSLHLLRHLLYPRNTCSWPRVKSACFTSVHRVSIVCPSCVHRVSTVRPSRIYGCFVAQRSQSLLEALRGFRTLSMQFERLVMIRGRQPTSS